MYPKFITVVILRFKAGHTRSGNLLSGKKISQKAPAKMTISKIKGHPIKGNKMYSVLISPALLRGWRMNLIVPMIETNPMTIYPNMDIVMIVVSLIFYSFPLDVIGPT